MTELTNVLQAVSGNCPVCGEAKSRHIITGKLVDVEIWHRVFTALGAKPSDAFTPITGPSSSSTRPLIAPPIIPVPREGDEQPQYRTGHRERLVLEPEIARKRL